MALTAAEATFNAAQLVAIAAWKTYIDTLSAGNVVTIVAVDTSLDAAVKPNNSQNSSTVGTLNGATGVYPSYSQKFAFQYADDAMFPIQLPKGPDGQMEPLFFLLTNQAGDLT